MATEESWVFYYKKQQTIPNIDRMPIHHLSCPRDRKRIIRVSNKNKIDGNVKKENESGKLTPGFQRNRHDSDQLDLELKSSESDSDKEDNADPRESRISEKVYVNACKHLHVVPGKRILRSLASTQVSAKERIVNPKEVQTIAYALTTNSSVTTFDVSGNNIGQDGLLNILRMLEENTSITYLNISHNKLGSDAVPLLSELIANNQKVKTLETAAIFRLHFGFKFCIGGGREPSYNVPGKKPLTFHKYTGKLSHIASLRHAGNCFNDNDAEEISEAIQKTKALKSINLSQNAFQEKGGKEMARVIEFNESLTELNLSWNHLRMTGATAIGAALASNSTLKALYLAWNGFSNGGCKEIATALQTNNTLELLDLSNNRIGLDGALSLAKGLLVNTKLRHLMLNLNSLTTKGAKEILAAIRENEESAVDTLELKEVPVLEEALNIIQELSSTRDHFTVIHDVKVLSEDFLVLKETMNKQCKRRSKSAKTKKKR